MALPTITIANTGGTTNSLSQVLTGSTVGIASGTDVDVYDNGAATPLGTAAVAADGTWSTDVVLLYGANAIVASVAAADGSVATSPEVDFSLEPVPSPPSNGLAPTPPVPTPVAVQHVRHADHPHSMFVFGAAPGQTLITGFRAAGAGHDGLDLPRSDFASIAAVLCDLHSVGHDAVLTLSPGNIITLEGVTAAALRAHPHDIWLHGSADSHAWTLKSPG